MELDAWNGERVPHFRSKPPRKTLPARVIEPTRALRPQVYLPFGLWRWAPLSFTVRTEDDPCGVIPAARAVVREIGKGQPI